MLKFVQSVAKFDPAEHPREPGGTPIGGRFAESGHSAAAAISDPALATQADAGITAVEKLIPEAVKTADYRRDVNPEKWDDVDQDTKNRVYDDWQESQMGNFYADTSELDKEVKKEVEDDNQKILDLAVDDTVTGVSKLFPDTAPVLDTGDPQAPPFQLYRKLDPDSIDYGYGEHDHNDNVPIDLEALKFTSGESLTPEEQQRVKTNWDTFYEKAFQNTLSEVYESDNYIERRQSLDDDALSDAWGEMSDEDKFNWLMSHPRLTKGGKLSQGEPKDWVTGVKEGSRNDEDYVRTRAVALRLTELRTDEIRKERGLLDPKEQTLPHYYITNDSILPDAKAGIGGVVSFEVSDDAGRTVAHASSSEEAKALGDAWAAKEAKQRAERSVTPSKEIIQHVWEAWKDKSSEGVGLSLQLAAAKEFGGYHRMTPDEVQAATEYVDDDFGGIPTMQAYVRAQWEVTQMIMKKAQESKVDVYRAIMLPGEKVNKAQNLPVDKYGGNYAPPTNIRSSTTSALPAPDQRAYVAFDFAGEHFSVVKQQWDDGRVETDEAAINRRVTKFYADKKWNRNTAPDLYLKLPDLQIQRAGAQSTTGTLHVANDWQGVGNLPDDPTRVVLRIEAPSTSVLSLPVYGKNIIGEHESVLMGTKDKWLWDAWRDKAPDFSSAKLAHKAEYEPLIVDLQAEDRGKPHWMTGVDWAVQKWEASQHPRDPKGEFTDKAAATLDAVDDLPVSPEIQELEEAWVGGVADFGDARAAEAIQNVEGYEEYRQSIADTLRKHLGDSITAYRSMSPNEYEDWTQGGGPQGLVGVTLDPEVAKHWEKFALNTEPRTVASFQIDPAHVVMRGSRNESEIVVDADWIEQKQLKAVKKWNESEPRDAQGRWTKSTYVPQHEVSEKGTWDWTGVDRNAMVGPGPKWVQQHRELVREALFAWLGDPGALRIHAQDAMVGAPPPDSGSGKERRAQAEALLWELEHNSKPIPMPLYRGSGPKGDRQNSQYSWSEDRDIAKTFAKRYGGTVQVLPAGTARGLRVRDYVGGMIEEKQWIVRAGNNPLTKKYDIPPKKQSVAKGEHDYGNTHIMIDPWSAAASSLNTARNSIRDEDRMGVGKDVDPNHITVRYGLLNENLDTLRTFIAHQQAFEAQVIGIELFPPSEYSEGAVPVVARISSPELHAVEAEIGKYADFKEKSFPVYKPHCTLAYCKPEAAPKYANLPVWGSCLVHSITISHASGVQETIPFGMTKKWEEVQKRQGKLWDESKHPRHPGGSSQGGEFESAPRDALNSILNGERASIDPGDLRKFMEMARDQPEDPNLLHLHVDGYKVFDQTGLGIIRDDMPQIPREHRENFLKEMKEAGVKIEKQWVDPLSLAPSQDEISARNAGEKLLKYETKDKEFPPLLVSQEGRVLDGHHHWAMMAALAIDAPHVKVPIYRLHVHVRQALAMMKAYDRKYHIKPKSLTTKADPVSGRYVTPFVSFDKQGDDQLRMIASLNSSRLATWGFTAEAEVRGLARYRITAVLDGRTSEFCRFIDGKIFETTDAREKVIEALNVQNPDDLRTVQPWPKQTKAAMADFREMSNDELVDRGLHIPPYHPYCRTLLRPVTSSSDELDAEDIVPTIPDDVETFQPVTLADLQELGIDATQEDVDQWNAHVGMSPVELLSKLTGYDPQDVLTDGVGSKAIGFDEEGNVAFNPKGEVNGVEFKLGALLDPFTGIYYLTQADLATGTPSAEAAFLKKMFSALIDMGESSPTATAIAVGVAGNAAYYAKLGFLPNDIEWDSIRQAALDGLDTTLQPMLESLAPEDQELVRHLLQDKSVDALSALVDLPFEYEGKTIGEWILDEVGGTWELDLTDDAIIEQAKAYLS